MIFNLYRLIPLKIQIKPKISTVTQPIKQFAINPIFKEKK